MVACVNACKGIPNVALDDDVVVQMVELAYNARFIMQDDKDRHARIKSLSRAIIAKLGVK